MVCPEAVSSRVFNTVPSGSFSADALQLSQEVRGEFGCVSLLIAYLMWCAHHWLFWSAPFWLCRVQSARRRHRALWWAVGCWRLPRSRTVLALVKALTAARHSTA